MHLTYRGISLRPVVDADLPFLFRLMGDPTRVHLWLRSRPVYDEAGFQQTWSSWAAGMMGAKFVIESAARPLTLPTPPGDGGEGRVRGRPVGLVFDYDRTLDDGWTRITALVQEESIGRGAGVIGACLFMEWLFQTLPLRKMYHEVFAYNENVIRMWRKVGLTEEAVLKEDRYWNGAYWDLHVFALYREAWPKVRDRVLRVPGARRESRLAESLARGKEVSPTELHVPSNGFASGAE
jgi:RimJ/RimL family protein N-acetyltransferase